MNASKTLRIFLAVTCLIGPAPLGAEAARPSREGIPLPASASARTPRSSEIASVAVMSSSERDAMVRAILSLDLPAPRKLVSVPRAEGETFEERMSRNGWDLSNPANRGFRNVEKIVERNQLQELEQTLNPASRGDRS